MQINTIDRSNNSQKALPNSAPSQTPVTTLANAAIQQSSISPEVINLRDRTIILLRNNTHFHGMSETLFDDGTKYEGELNLANKPHGLGVMIHPDGAIFKGNFSEGKRDGEGVMILKDGSAYMGKWEADNMKGQGEMVFKDGTTYQGEFRDNMPNGHGTMTHTDGAVYVGAFENGKRHGHGLMTFPDGEKLEGEWKEAVFVENQQRTA